MQYMIGVDQTQWATLRQERQQALASARALADLEADGVMPSPVIRASAGWLSSFFPERPATVDTNPPTSTASTRQTWQPWLTGAPPALPVGTYRQPCAILCFLRVHCVAVQGGSPRRSCPAAAS